MPKLAAAPDVPFLGPVKLGTVGKRVVYYKRALSRAGFYPWLGKFTPFAGPTFVLGVVRFQRSAKMQPNAILGEKTHDVLRRRLRKNSTREWAFGPYEGLGMEALYEAVTAAERIAAYWRWWDWF